MKNRIIAGVALFIAMVAIWSIAYRPEPTNYVVYHGEKIKLTKSYPDFDEYKNDPDNLDPSETARVQQLVMSAQIARQFPERMGVFRASSDIAFPGYGSGGMVGAQFPNGDDLTGFSVEIPRLDKERYFVFRSHDGVYNLIDDFVAGGPRLHDMRAEKDEIVFFDLDQKPALRRKLNAP